MDERDSSASKRLIQTKIGNLRSERKTSRFGSGSESAGTLGDLEESGGTICVPRRNLLIQMKMKNIQVEKRLRELVEDHGGGHSRRSAGEWRNEMRSVPESTYTSGSGESALLEEKL